MATTNHVVPAQAGPKFCMRFRERGQNLDSRLARERRSFYQFAMADTAHILILDDDTDVACAAQMLLRRRHGRVATLDDPARLAGLLEEGVPDVVLLDLNFTPGRIDGAEGLAVLDRLRALAHPPAVIALTAYADVPLAVEALKRGAGDFITKPWDNARLIAAVDGALARRTARSSGGAAMSGLMGDSAPCGRESDDRQRRPHRGQRDGAGRERRRQGTGGARHPRGVAPRRCGTFLAVDMGALPESTFESELFGHRKGSFTDARSDRAGRFQTARGGSLFLDEIGNMPLASQAKLLTALERREVTPIGADRPEAIDVRIVSATNLDERAPVRSGRVPAGLAVPPEHHRDPRAAAARTARRRSRPAAPLPVAVRGAVRAPGARAGAQRARAPVRVGVAGQCARAAPRLRTRRDPGGPGRVPLRRFWPGDAGAGVGRAVMEAPLHGRRAALDGADGEFRLGALERETIAAALDKAKGNISLAARMLGLSRAALYRKLGKHGI
jgi:DNA-binding NtrC family response regulator